MLVVQYILAYSRKDVPVTCGRGLIKDTTQSWVCYVVEFRSFSCVALGGKRACKSQIGQQAYNSECLAILAASTFMLPRLLSGSQLFIQELAPMGVNDGLVF